MGVIILHVSFVPGMSWFGGAHGIVGLFFQGVTRVVMHLQITAPNEYW
jgi:hypothetical protein